MSALVPEIVTTEITSEVSSDTSVDVYDGIPPITKIDFGFYVVPGDYDIPSYIQSVDNGAFGPHVHNDVSGYISSESYTMPKPVALSDPYAYDLSNYGYPLSTCELSMMQAPLQGNNDYYATVDRNCSLEPYVDKIYWTIDADSIYTLPNNIRWDRG